MCAAGSLSRQASSRAYGCTTVETCPAGEVELEFSACCLCVTAAPELCRRTKMRKMRTTRTTRGTTGPQRLPGRHGHRWNLALPAG